ncbi:type II toxin-antitoxin system RelE/ParE family toxin [Candidatus Bathyarchaeota archaeon]|jgi:mRNA interferase RelE/StbE|nr:type II toxin-antitoxin system RelE/ParE family toxin [Candidatus Bathyarchaeota archaeon]
MFAVNIKRKALRNLEKLDKKQKQRIAAIIGILKKDPIPFRRADVCKLRGYESTYRIRIGDLRLVYQVSWNERIVLIHYIGPRERAYE